MKNLFFIIWGDPKFYQTLIFLSQKISKENYNIFIISRNLSYKKDIIKKVNFGKNVKILKSPKLFIKFGNSIEYFFFIFFVAYHFIIKRPTNVIFFNKKALFNILILKIFASKVNYIYHNFDFDLIQNTKIFKEKILIKLELFCAKLCKNLVFPSKERSNIYQKITNEKQKKFYYFLNCFPINFKSINTKNFKKYLIKKKIFNKKIICHLGSIGENHYLKEIIESFRFINTKLVLIIAGNSINNYASNLRYLIEHNKLNKKVFIIEDVSNDYWYEILKYSKLGLCFYKQNSISHKYMAGTSQKFNNYLKFNIPMLVNDSNDFRRFKKKYDIYNVVKLNNRTAISNSIKNIFKNKKRYKKIKCNMRKAFRQNLNFEKQYENTYKKIL